MGRLGLALIIIFQLSVLLAAAAPRLGEDCFCDVKIKSRSAGYLCVRFLDGQSGSPVHGVDVLLASWYTCERSLGVDLAPGEYTVVAQHEQYYPVRLPGVKILDGYMTELTVHLRERDTSGALSDSTLSDVYNVSMKALLDASPGDFYGRICDLISGIPLADAEVALPDFGVAARTDEEGVFAVRKPPAGKERLDWQISHPEYETLYVNTAGIDTLYASRLMACVVPRTTQPEGEATSSTNSARFMISVFSWGGGVHAICSTAVTVGRGETFGYVQLPCRSVSDTFKLVEVNRDGTAKVDFAAHLSIGTVDSNWKFYEDTSMAGPVVVGSDPVYWRTPTIDAGEIYSLRRIR